MLHCTRLWLMAVGLVACAPAPPPPAMEHPNLLVVDIDSLRADRPFAERSGRPVMPNVQALARRGVRFTNAIAQSGWTTPALVSILTGHLPVPIEMGGASTAVLPPDARPFPAVLALYGYRSTIFWGPGVEANIPDLSRGFTTRVQHGFQPGDEHPFRDVLRDDVLTEPFAVMLHDFDAHGPPPALRASPDRVFGEEELDCGSGEYPDMLRRLQPRLGKEGAVAHMLAHYDSSLHAYDAFLGALFDGLEARGVLDRTVIVLTSNHGEDIGDRGGDLKHGSLYDVVLRVPLVVAGPGIQPAGRIVDTPVQGIDLAPTFLALAHAPLDRTALGASFLPLLSGEEMPAAYAERPIYSLTNTGNVSVRTPTRKLIRSDRPDWRPPGAPAVASSGSVHEYYDLVADPQERNNLYAARSGEATKLEGDLQAFLDDRIAAAAGGSRQDVDPELREQFRGKGYWGIVGGDDPEPEPLPIAATPPPTASAPPPPLPAAAGAP